jgi:hypothetical protein
MNDPQFQRDLIRLLYPQSLTGDLAKRSGDAGARSVR